MTDDPTPVRTHRGTFAPGISGNPGGRVGLPADVRQMLEDAVPQAVATLLNLISSKDDRVSLAATEALLSRLYGKPAQQINANVTNANIGELHLQALQEIQDRRRLRIINETPTDQAN